MNEINISNDRIETAAVLSTAASPVQLRRIEKNLFAVTSPTLDEPSYVFDSPALGRYLDQQHPTINAVALVKLCSLVGRNENWQLKLEIGLSNGHHLTLDQKDQLFEAAPVKGVVSDSVLQSPVQVWGLAAELPFACMLLTKRLVESIDTLANDGQHSYLLNVLWKEYERAADEAAEGSRTQTIDGEFMRFTARPFHRHLVVFDGVGQL